MLGSGSNLLVSDRGYPGLVVRASRLNLDVLPLPADDGLVAAMDLVRHGRRFDAEVPTWSRPEIRRTITPRRIWSR